MNERESYLHSTRIKMRIPKIWLNLSIFNLCIVALLGFLLRSKQLFEMQFIDYNHLVDAHGRFAFGAWVTLTLFSLLIYEVLPEAISKKRIYSWLLAGIFIFSWAALISMSILGGNSMLSNIFATLFIFVCYILSGVFIRDILQTSVHKTVMMLSISAVVFLIMSSGATFSFVILFYLKSLNAIYYRDALFTYLHMQYNGFFTLAVFALLFHKLLPKVSDNANRQIFRFSVLIICSIIPSLFLSYLWSDPPQIFWILAGIGSLFVFLTFISFVILSLSVRHVIHLVSPIVRYFGILSMCAFGIKEFLQGFTIFPIINNAVFASRPTIIGFLHLVFLGFATHFILGWYYNREVFGPPNKNAIIALVFFSIGVVMNEVILMIQGLGSMFIIGYSIFAWFLWAASIWMLVGTLMIGFSRIAAKKV